MSFPSGSVPLEKFRSYKRSLAYPRWQLESSCHSYIPSCLLLKKKSRVRIMQCGAHWKISKKGMHRTHGARHTLAAGKEHAGPVEQDIPWLQEMGVMKVLRPDVPSVQRVENQAPQHPSLLPPHHRFPLDLHTWNQAREGHRGPNGQEVESEPQRDVLWDITLALEDTYPCQASF